VPTGFIGYDVTHRAVKGHQFGLDLTDRERKARLRFCERCDGSTGRASYALHVRELVIQAENAAGCVSEV
jgi:hypothetical protein